MSDKSYGMRRRVLKAAVACTLGLGMLSFGATASAAANGKYSIGFTVYGMSGWVSSGYDGVKKVAKADNVDLHWASANFSVAKQVSQVRQFIAQHVDAIIIDPVDSSALGPQIKKARAEGIKVFGTNVKIFKPGSKYLTSYIGPDDVLAGEHEAEAMVKKLGGHGNVVILQGPLGQSAQIDRAKGIDNVLKKHPGIKVLAKQPGNWSRVKGYNITAAWLSTYGNKIDGIISQNDDMAVGAIRALKQRHMKNVPVVGIDGIKSGLLAVKSGDELMTNLQDAPLQLGMALQVAVNSLKGQQVKRHIFIHMPQVRKNNVGHYWNQMYKNRDQFLANLPKLINDNLASGNYGHQ